MSEGEKIFATIVQGAVALLNEGEAKDPDEAVQLAMAANIINSNSLDSVLSHIETTYGKGENPYDQLVGLLEGQVVRITNTPGDSDDPKSKTQVSPDEVTPKNPWYITIMTTDLPWPEAKEKLDETFEDIELKEIEEPGTVSKVTVAMFPTRERAEQVWENTVPSANLVVDDAEEDADESASAPIMLRVIDVSFGVLDFRDTIHPLVAPDNELLQYQGTNYVYMSEIAKRTMYVDSEAGLWRASDEINIDIE